MEGILALLFLIYLFISRNSIHGETSVEPYRLKKLRGLFSKIDNAKFLSSGSPHVITLVLLKVQSFLFWIIFKIDL